MKILYNLLWTVIATALGAIPFVFGSWLWKVFSPESEAGKIVTGGVLLYFGGGLTVVWEIVVFILWFSFVKVTLESKF